MLTTCNTGKMYCLLLLKTVVEKNTHINNVVTLLSCNFICPPLFKLLNGAQSHRYEFYYR